MTDFPNLNLLVKGIYVDKNIIIISKNHIERKRIKILRRLVIIENNKSIL